jgi:hypothetical protein
LVRKIFHNFISTATFRGLQEARGAMRRLVSLLPSERAAVPALVANPFGRAHSGASGFAGDQNMITVNKIDDTTFEVTVEGGSTTSHRVTVSDAVHEKLTGGKASREQLVEQSFRFLLDREPNTSILRQFDLPAIGRYFPEYEEQIRRRFP